MSAGEETVGFVGVGLMGYGICRSLLRAGFEVEVVAHRRRDRVDDLLARGARERPDITTLAASVDVLMLCLPGPGHVRDLLGGPRGLLAVAPDGLTVFDCTTSDPDLTIELATAAARGVRLVDLPLMKGPAQAIEGELNLIVGAAAEQVAGFRSLFDAISRRQFFTGAVGNAHRIKLLNNSLSMCMLAAICETFATASAAGVDLRLLFEVISSGNADSAILRRTAPNLIAGDFPVSATVATCMKDSGLFANMEARVLERVFMGPAAHALFRLAADRGLRDADGSEAFTALGGTPAAR